MSFRIIPVIDLKGGMAVHAVGGRRDQYRPLRSIWQARAGPLALAAALRDGLGIAGVYLADLDAIAGRWPDLACWDSLLQAGFELWLDAGVRDRHSLLPLARPGKHSLQIVAGLETLGGPRELAGILERIGPDRLIFSLDLDEGEPRVAHGASWPNIEPLEVVSQVIELGVRRLILLDLARVGTRRGIGTESLLTRIRSRCVGVEITVGGGIRGIDDVLSVADQGASAVLVGSALHDGRIGRAELERMGSLMLKED